MLGLVGARIGDGPHQVPQVETVIDEILRQRVEQRRVARRIRGADIVHRIDDAAAEEVAPHAVRRSTWRRTDSPSTSAIGEACAARWHRSESRPGCVLRGAE